MTAPYVSMTSLMHGIDESLLGHDNWVDCVAVPPDDAWRRREMQMRKLRIWDMPTNWLVGHPWDAHDGSAVAFIAWSPDGGGANG